MTDSLNEKKLRDAWTREQRRLYEILDRDPAEAIEAAQQLRPKEELDESIIASLRACVFVDAGQELKDVKSIRKGVDIFWQIHESEPNRPEAAYNLANGLMALAQVTSWPNQLASSDMRQEARRLFADCWATTNDYSLRTQAKTNQANLLAQAYRWVEAYDTYWDALLDDPLNGVASSGMARILLKCIKRGLGPNEHFRQLATKYLRMAEESEERIREYGGSHAVEAVKKMSSEQLYEPPQPERDYADGYTRFVAENRLALSLTIEGVDNSVKRWDTLAIESICEGIQESFGIPPIFAMFNTLKSDYIAARWLTYVALKQLAPETGYYSDTLDYANYGISQGILLFAQRSAIDILNRIAVAASEYLGLPGRSRSITFWDRWHKVERRRLKTPLEWQQPIEEEIKNGNTTLIALSELAVDVMQEGYLNLQKTLRNASTHRFVILHELGNQGSRPSNHIEHYSQEDFEKQTLRALRIARAALFYFREMITFREARLEKNADGPMGILDVPPHHWIRGEDA